MKIYGSNLARAVEGIVLDQRFMKSVNPEFCVRSGIRAFLQNPSVRFGFFARLARGGGLSGRLAREVLISQFASDVTPGPEIRGGLYVPHPIGIVIGEGVRFEGNCRIYQNVTIGGDKHGRYPVLGDGVKIFPNSVVFGETVLVAGTTVGAGQILGT